MSKSYEELVGALGRGIFFRPERKRVRDLLSRDAEPRIVVGEDAFKLFDISMNGLSFVCARDRPSFPPGDEVDLSVQLYGESAYRGRARVVRVEPSSAGARVAVALTTGFLDLPEIIRRDEEGRLRRELESGGESVRALVPQNFQEITARAVNLLQYFRRSLKRHEARYRKADPKADEALSTLARAATSALRERWQSIEHSASEAALEFMDDPVALRAAKEFTETNVTQLLLGSPMHQRSYDKPLGYPGDYQIMLYVYADGYEGNSAFDRALHKLAMEHPLAHGIRTRKDFIVELMLREHQRQRGNSAEPSYRVTSLGCGPAREVVEFMERAEGWPGQVSFTLIDQEEEALSIAYRDGQRALARSNGQGQLSCLNLSFGQLLSDPTLVSGMPPQHFVYSTGLFDYLSERRAQALVRALYERLEPGGFLAVGNALAPNTHFWTLEFLLDWTLLYRTSAEMRRLAHGLPEGAEVDVVREPGQAYHFLTVRKPREQA